MLDAARLSRYTREDTPHTAPWQVLPQRDLRWWLGHSVTMAYCREQHGAVPIERPACCILSWRLVRWQGGCMCENTNGTVQERHCRGVLHTCRPLLHLQSTHTDFSSSTPLMSANHTTPTSATEQPKRGKSQSSCAPQPNVDILSSAWATST